ncbi:MAG: hypothetical protein NUV69_02175 [Candidatus Curtissbacteria bacterium]|nr:hypothetical protein [Candidatus Curtissbacteria bacterium]
MQDDPNNIPEPTDEDLENTDSGDAKSVPTVDESKPDEDQFTDPVAAPSVTGEEDPFSGDATNSESPDIDDALKSVGLHGDDSDENPTPLGVDKELEDEEL